MKYDTHFCVLPEFFHRSCPSCPCHFCGFQSRLIAPKNFRGVYLRFRQSGTLLATAIFRGAPQNAIPSNQFQACSNLLRVNQGKKIKPHAVLPLSFRPPPTSVPTYSDLFRVNPTYSDRKKYFSPPTSNCNSPATPVQLIAPLAPSCTYLRLLALIAPEKI